MVRSEERLSEARIALNAAKSQINKMGPQSYEDQERAYKRALAAHEELTTLAKRCVKWQRHFGRECANGMARVRAARNEIEQHGPRALARLTQMIEALQIYLRNSAGGPSHGR